MTSVGRRARVLAAATLAATVTGWFLASNAGASSFTLFAPVPIAQNGVAGTINPVTDTTGAILMLDGTVNLGFVGQDVFLFDVTLFAGSAVIDDLGVSVGTGLFFLNPVGAGAFDDTASGDIAPLSVQADNLVTFSGLFSFPPLISTQTTVRLFVTYVPEGDILIGQDVSFMISSGTDFTVQGTVPEPSAGLLLAAGLGALTAMIRRLGRGRWPGRSS